MSPLAHPKGKTPSRSCNLRKGVFLRLAACQSLSLWERWHCEAMTERASPARKSRRRSDRQALCQSDTIAVSELFGSSLALSVSLRSPRPGCGSQRLLRCRSHPAGRGPNSSSLFPPLAAVVAVAPSRGASGEEIKLCGLPKPPLGRGGGTASAVTERLSPGAVTPAARLRGLREFVENARLKRKEFVNVIKMRRRY